ncbi:MAG: DUF454 family protein, partial [Vibrio sp.]
MYLSLQRWLFAVIGITSLCLGIICLFVPVLPTTPFILIARAS